MSPQAFIFIGRSGAGKGTQAALLMDALRKAEPLRGIQYVQTGLELREFIKGMSYTQQTAKELYEGGALMPEFLTVYVWVKALAERHLGGEHVVFDGTPRKVHEAGVLHSVFGFYGLQKPWVINLAIEPDAALARLLARKRLDDGEEAIRKRLAWYETDVAPTVNFYRDNSSYNFLSIDGNRPIGEVHKEILEKVGLIG